MLRPILSISSIAAVSLLTSCAGTPRVPEKSAESYHGPPLAVESMGSQHRVVLNAPTGGWTFRLDRTCRCFDHTDVYLTVVRPNPAFMQTQGQVRQEAGTQIEPSQPIKLFARVLPYDAVPGRQAYSTVPTGTPRSGP